MAGARPPADFLSRLAVRALGLGPVLAPRIPSAFEPAAPGDDPEGGDVEHAPATAMESGPVQGPAAPPAPQAGAATRASPAARLAASPSPAGPRLADIAPADAPDSPDIDGLQPPEREALLAAVPALPVPELPAEEAVPLRRLRLLEPARAGPRRASARAADDRLSAIEDRTFQAGAPEQGRAPPRDPQGAIAAFEDRPLLAVPREVAEALPRTLPVMRPVPVAPGGERAGPRSEAEPLPGQVVNVTIGRIEVRAAAPGPVPAPRAAPRPDPPESLSDYLKRRDGGR